VLLLGLLFTRGSAFACLALYPGKGRCLPVFSPWSWFSRRNGSKCLGPLGLGTRFLTHFAAALDSLRYRSRGRRFSFLGALMANRGWAGHVILPPGELG